MTRYTRQDYIDVDYATVCPVTYPICQLKYDGIWCGADLYQDRTCEYMSRHGQRKLVEHIQDPFSSGLYVGELMFGSEWSKEQNREGQLWLFDLLETPQGDHRNEPYIERYARLAYNLQAKTSSSKWNLVINFPTEQILDIWETLVASGHYEGVVFRNPNASWNAVIPRAKFELTEDLYVTGFVEGEGRLRGSLGALKASYSPVGIGPELLIGGGFSDPQRKAIWKNQTECLGRCFIVKAKKKFKSGLLRHPVFAGWHPDK